MSLIRYLFRLAGEVLAFGVAGRRPGLALVLVLAAIIAVVSVTVQWIGPAALYPFL